MGFRGGTALYLTEAAPASSHSSLHLSDWQGAHIYIAHHMFISINTTLATLVGHIINVA
jgi:hypothetical protein